MASRNHWRVAATSLVYRPCLKLPLRAPVGAPLPSAPPCIRHRRRPVTGADLHGSPDLVRAPHRSEHDTRPVSVRRMGLSVILLLVSLSHPFRHSRYRLPPGLLGE